MSAWCLIGRLITTLKLTMFSKFYRALAALLFLVGGSAFAQSAKPELLLYCGITMVHPMTEIARLFEARENVKLSIAQGGSEHLYQSAKKAAWVTGICRANSFFAPSI